MVHAATSHANIQAVNHAKSQLERFLKVVHMYIHIETVNGYTPLCFPFATAYNCYVLILVQYLLLVESKFNNTD